MSSTTEFPFQSGCSMCQASQDYSQLMTGGARKIKRSSKKSTKKSTKGSKKRSMKRGGADDNIMNNNIGVSWATATGGQRRQRRQRRQNGGAETEGATGMAPNFYDAGSNYPPHSWTMSEPQVYGSYLEKSFPNTNLYASPNATGQQTGGKKKRTSKKSKKTAKRTRKMRGGDGVPDMSGQISSAIGKFSQGIQAMTDRVSSFKLGGGKKRRVAKKSTKKSKKSKKSTKRSRKMRGGGSDWVSTFYSRGAVNTNTPNDKTLFTQFADASEYISKYDLLHPDTSLATGDNMKTVRP